MKKRHWKQRSNAYELAANELLEENERLKQQTKIQSEEVRELEARLRVRDTAVHFSSDLYLRQTCEVLRRDVARWETEFREVHLPFAEQLRCERDRLKGELAKIQDAAPLTQAKIRQGDFLASSVRGLLLHCGLVRTGGEAHAMVAEGKVFIGARRILDAEQPPRIGFLQPMESCHLDLKCGDAICEVTVTE